MSASWGGFYYDGVKTSRHAVKITLTPNSIVIVKADKTSVEWPSAEVRQTQGFYAGEPIKLEHGRESLIVDATITNGDFLQSLKAAAADNSSRFEHPISRKSRLFYILVSGIAGTAVLVSLYLWIIPFTAYRLAKKIPTSWEEKLGQSVMDDFLAGSKPCDSKELKASVDNIMAQLNSAAIPHPYSFKVHIVKSRVMNAFALPGGHIVLFTGLIEKTERSEELAGVLAHEMQHVLKKHSTKHIIQSFSTGMILHVLVGNASNVLNAANTLGNMRYSRISEREADEAGVKLIIRAGIDPSGMTDFFTKLEKEHGKDMPSSLTFIQTHPATSDRISSIKQYIASAEADFTKLLPETKWDVVSKGCSTSSNNNPSRPNDPNPIEDIINGDSKADPTPPPSGKQYQGKTPSPFVRRYLSSKAVLYYSQSAATDRMR